MGVDHVREPGPHLLRKCRPCDIDGAGCHSYVGLYSSGSSVGVVEYKEVHVSHQLFGR
jgi:hypothetical protein